jgi:NADH-quinone oxidoreductase subunit L
VGAFALAAIPPTTAGLSSKDEILSLAWHSGGAGKVFWAIGIAGAFITSVYIFRLVFIVFAGNPRGAVAGAEAGGHAAGRNGAQAGLVMGIPLALLALFCVAGGFLNLPSYLGGKPFLLDFLHTALPTEPGVAEATTRTEWILSIVAEAASLLGIPVAWLITQRAPAAASARRATPVRFLQAGWGFDWLYDLLFVRPFVWLARINFRDIVDRLFDGLGGLFMLLSRAFRWTQNGRVRWYAAGIAAGAVLIVAAVVLS